MADDKQRRQMHHLQHMVLNHLKVVGNIDPIKKKHDGLGDYPLVTEVTLDWHAFSALVDGYLEARSSSKQNH